MTYPPERDMRITRVCPTSGCSVISTVMVDGDDFIKWRRRDKIQDAMPYVSASEREILITGICPDCWDKKKEDEEES